MSDSSFWSDVALGYSPLIDRHRNVTATRLTVFSQRTAFPSPDTEQLLKGLADAWPDGMPSISLNVLSEGMLIDLLHGELPGNLMIEVPSFMAVEPLHADAINRQHSRGIALLLKGRPAGEMPKTIAHCFKYSVVDLADDRRLHGEDQSIGRGAAQETRTQAFIHSGVSSIEDLEASFKRGSAGIFGWPIDEAVTAGAKPNKLVTPPDLSVIAELIGRVDKQESIDKLENTLRRDPTLAFKLVRFINSPAFGIRVEISSFKHAIMMLGYQRLKRWLALLLATASKDTNQRPLMYAAVRRGLLMEELVRSTGDEEVRSEVFICGVFSLLDRMFKQPFSELLRTIPVAERVAQALVDGSGPYQPYMDMVRAIEGESLFDIRASSEALMMGMPEANHALIRALAVASSLE